MGDGFRPIWGSAHRNMFPTTCTTRCYFGTLSCRILACPHSIQASIWTIAQFSISIGVGSLHEFRLSCEINCQALVENSELCARPQDLEKDVRLKITGDLP